MPGNSVSIEFMFQDWLYLSQQIQTSAIITDNEILLGVKEGTLTLPLPTLVASDKAGQSKYEVGGRIYFEAQVKDAIFSTFVSNGFFDR